MIVTKMSEKNKKGQNTSQKTEDTTPQTITLNDGLQMLLDSLEVEEQELLQEKADLTGIEEKLTRKIKDEITAKEAKITDLKKEIPKLKQRCETLAYALGIKIQE
jgi:hypothetical protein